MRWLRWYRGARLEALIAPHYPKLGRRVAEARSRSRRCCVSTACSKWYTLSDSGAEEALYDIQSMRAFADLEFGRDAIPDETTILNFRHLLERYDLAVGELRALRCLSSSSSQG